MGEGLGTAASKAWAVTVDQAASFFPKLLLGLVVLLLGLVIARVVRTVTARFFVAIRLDRLSDRMGISEFLARGDVRHTIAEILATATYWIVLLFSLQILALIFNLEGLTSFFGQILAYFPRLLGALAIVLIGIIIGSFFGGAVQLAASNARFPAAQVLGTVVKYMISFFAIVMALEQLQIATRLLEATVQIVIAAAALALALAFGLGCRDLAKDAVKEWLRDAEGPQGAKRDKAAGPE